MKKLIPIAILVAAFSQQSLAGYVDESANPLGVPAEQQHISITGSGQPEVVHGFGKDIPLAEALNQIIPRTFSVRTFGISEGIRVSWQGGKNWIDVLSNATARIDNLQINIDKDGRFVTLRQAAAKKGASEMRMVSGAQTVTWKLAPGKPIHEQLEQWAYQSGWTFEWKAKKSWIVPAAAEFPGPFDRALEDVVRSMYGQGHPLVLKLWEGNHVAEIIEADAN